MLLRERRREAVSCNFVLRYASAVPFPFQLVGKRTAVPRGFALVLGLFSCGYLGAASKQAAHTSS